MKKLILLITMFTLVNCSSTKIPLKRNYTVKPKTNSQRIKDCIDSLMSEQGTNLEETFKVCEKIHRR